MVGSREQLGPMERRDRESSKHFTSVGNTMRSRSETQIVEKPRLPSGVDIERQADGAVVQRARERARRRGGKRETQRRVGVLRLAGELDLTDVLIEHVA